MTPLELEAMEAKVKKAKALQEYIRKVTSAQESSRAATNGYAYTHNNEIVVVTAGDRNYNLTKSCYQEPRLIERVKATIQQFFAEELARLEKELADL